MLGQKRRFQEEITSMMKSDKFVNLKEQIIRSYPDMFIEFYLIGSANELEQDTSDIDIVAIVKDNSSIIELNEKISSLVVNCSLEVNIWVSLFLIKKTEFYSNNTGFLKNVKNYGKPL